MATANQIARLKKTLEVFAEETLIVEEIGGTWYAFGSELATLRLYRVYKASANVTQGFSTNLNTFYFSLTPKF